MGNLPDRQEDRSTGQTDSGALGGLGAGSTTQRWGVLVSGSPHACLPWDPIVY